MITIFKKVWKKIVRELRDNRRRPPAIYNIGKRFLPQNSKRALVVFSIESLPYFLKGKLEQFPYLTHHSRYWESAEIARLLNCHGYIVDYFHSKGYPKIVWNKYDLIIDCVDNLKDAPYIAGQTKVYYSCGIHWITWNLAELNRTRMFHERTGIVVPTNRQIISSVSDQYADIITYYGTDLQINSFDKKPKKIQLNISSVIIPTTRKKNIAKARNNFLWLGGGGMLHKGMDLVLEAFAKMPRANLYIAGGMEDEPKFWGWAKTIIATHENIHYLGFMDVASRQFEEVANECIGIVYASAAEGGPGSVAQALHFGLIPMVTPSSLVRAEILGYSIDGSTDTEIIRSIIERVRSVMNLPEHELRQKSDAVREFALRYHTRSAYTESFEQLLDRI